MKTDEMTDMYKFTKNLMRRHWSDLVDSRDLNEMVKPVGHTEWKEWQLMKQSELEFVRFFGYLKSKDYEGAKEDKYWAIRWFGYDKTDDWVGALDDPHPQILLTASARLAKKQEVQ